ncbi:MerR family transcriptional regulator [Filobacillus milosensis]|uniref:MerR family transcriptional regulator n=1 Tax=Filobacillus milosensis TaxID=94137 RepID=UPI0018913777|nr:MerR family transcriptional regulator [Filobacillus milosensis]
MEGIYIKELTTQCNVNKETIRYYERLGLINKPNRTKSGYRLFSKDTIQRVKFIKKMQELGFSLKDIAVFLSIEDKNLDESINLQGFIEEKLNEVQARISNLENFNVKLEVNSNK